MQYAKHLFTLLATVAAVGLTACGQEKKPEAAKPQAAAPAAPKTTDTPTRAPDQ